ncbi:MAG TPA: DUF1549 and DUF1553 domain-containing protein [Gemmataceae bacterium]|nr:DUF1549 and DUF1553 domain-containing protein [Gemmataceae bacterium]
MLGSALNARFLASFPFQKQAIAVLALALFTTLPAAGALPTKPGARAEVIGHPTALDVIPATIVLKGPRAMQQVVVSGHYADGSVRDLTPFCDFAVEGTGLAAVAPGGFLTPRRDGQATLVAKIGGQTARVSLLVKEFDKPQPISFRHEMVAALNVGGCNMGACHGTPSGKNGFRLSLRGYDPASDYIQLTRDVLGRRTDRLNPQASLIMLKPLGGVPHEGGLRFQASSVPAQVFKGWLSEGLRDDPVDLPALKGIQVLPGTRVLNEPAQWQQLAVIAHFADGSSRDVTRLTVFSTSDNAVADVSSLGLVEFQQSGEVAILCRYLDEMYSLRLTYLQTKKDFKWVSPAQNNYIDKFVFDKLKMLSIQPSELCSDQEFVRRVHLDVCGVLPTPEETNAFLASHDSNKRSRLIDKLLERPEYADFWTMKWSDVLRSDRKTIQEKGIHVFQDWLHSRMERNAPFDQIVRELLTANGSTFANPPANYYRIARDPQNLAETTAQLFFGIRMQCAKCHNHPFERWTQDDYYSMAAFFARVRQMKDPVEPGSGPQAVGAAEYIYSDRGGEVVQPRTGRVMPPKYMGGPVANVPPGKDRRQVLADWLTSADNPFFAKSVVNRVWFHVVGRGIVDPVDDFRDSNPSANDELLSALAKDFVAHKFDVKYLIRVILNSRVYQLSAQTNDLNKDDNKYFSHAVTRLLTAEQLLDAICAATQMPEKYPGLPLGTHATQLPDGEINNIFLKTFGQPARELACECEREGESNLAQALQLINGPTINDKVRGPNNRLGKLLAEKKEPPEILKGLYLASLSRPPADGEIKAALEHVSKGKDKRKAWEDVQWALLNSKEFLFRH